MGGPVGRSTLAAALVAVALLSFASVKSQVMQALAAATPLAQAVGACPDMAGMADMGQSARGDVPATSRKACEYCAAAAHAPLCVTAVGVTGSSILAWTTYAPTPRVTVGWRALPTPRARGPPALSPQAI